MKHGYRRAACHERLLINLKHLGLKDTVEWTQALADARRDCGAGTVALWKVEATAGDKKWRAPKEGERIHKSAVARVGVAAQPSRASPGPHTSPTSLQEAHQCFADPQQSPTCTTGTSE